MPPALNRYEIALLASSELVVDRVTNGQGATPSLRNILSEEQIRDVAAYVSSAAGS